MLLVRGRIPSRSLVLDIHRNEWHAQQQAPTRGDFLPPAPLLLSFSFPRLDNHFLRRQRDQRPQRRVIPSSIIRRHTNLHTRQQPRFPIKLHMLWRRSQQQHPSISTHSTLGNCISPRAAIRAPLYTSLGRRQPRHERLERVEPAHDGGLARAVEHGVRYRDRRVGRAAAGEIVDAAPGGDIDGPAKLVGEGEGSYK